VLGQKHFQKSNFFTVIGLGAGIAGDAPKQKWKCGLQLNLTTFKE
jgi:hypothetical protein